VPRSGAVAIREAATRDTRAILELLLACELPIDGVPDDTALLLVAEQGARVVGCAGLELHGTDGLLRSVAVAPDVRVQGVAQRLCDEIERQASGLGARRLYLLTETAEVFFARRGYGAIERGAAPGGISASLEFAAVCPASAALMLRELDS
jgi:amino-acid N-acetyltransferase